MRKWRIINRLPLGKYGEFKIDDLIKTLLANRGIKTKKEIEEFLNPKIEDITVDNLDIDKTQLGRAVKRIKEAFKKKEQIVVFGDYDVDGICGTAILWENLNNLGGKVMPYIPHRVDEGYGLSKKGIQNLGSSIQNVKLIITVDNGIVANDAVNFAKKEGIDVIITDHHARSKKQPDAYAIIHTTKLCGAGVAYLLAQEISNSKFQVSNKSQSPKTQSHNNHLELVALATVADLVPLKGASRTLLKYGLEKLRKTTRIGLLKLFKEAGIERENINTYIIGYIICPRLNAAGRLEHAMDSLRLLCTKDQGRAKILADKLENINRRRQELTIATLEHAKIKIQNFIQLELKDKPSNIIFIADESYEEGIIGLIAGRLVEEFYRPAIVVSKGEKYSKASARSINGFNIIEFIRTASDLLVDAGGHPMAAGFTVATEKLGLLQELLEKKAKSLLRKKLLSRVLNIDCELPFEIITKELYSALNKLSPFGIGNPQPTFVSKNIIVSDIRLIGDSQSHLKLRLSSGDSGLSFDGIAFGAGNRAKEINRGDTIDIVYVVDEDRWNGNIKINLKIKDFLKVQA